MSHKLKLEVLAAFNAAGINIVGAVVNTTCSVVLPGDRYLAWYGAHQGFQICRKREVEVEGKVVVYAATSPRFRTTVSGAQAKAWASEGIWSDGTPCKHGWAVIDGVEMGRKAPIEAPIGALTAPGIDLSAVVLALATAGKTKDEIIEIVAALKA